MEESYNPSPDDVDFGVSPLGSLSRAAHGALHSVQQESFKLPVRRVQDLINNSLQKLDVNVSSLVQAESCLAISKEVARVTQEIAAQITAIPGNQVILGDGKFIDKESLRLFVGDLLHFVRNIAGGVEGYSGLILRDLQQGNTAKEGRLASLRQSLEAIPQIFDTHQQFLEKDLVTQQAVPINEIWEFVKANLQTNISAKNLSFVLTGECAGLVTRERHALGGAALATCFENILTNAIKYSPEGSSVSVDFSRHGDYLVFSVKDSGIGIPSDQLTEVTSGKRAANAIASGISGSGYGLSRVNNIISKLGGKLFLQSPINPLSDKSPGTGVTLMIPIQSL